jgi:hypothetical protein
MQSKIFSERLEAAIARYHSNALTTAQVLEELIQHAKDIRAARARGEETGLSDEEIAFYDALAENDSAREAMGEPALRVIAHELVMVIKGNLSVDWMHRDSARARIRTHVKRLLRKYGYPPDLQDAAVRTSCSRPRRYRLSGQRDHPPVFIQSGKLPRTSSSVHGTPAIAYVTSLSGRKCARRQDEPRSISLNLPSRIFSSRSINPPMLSRP